MHYSFIYLEKDPSLTIVLRAEAKENVERLNRFIKLSLRENQGGLPASILSSVASLVVGEGRASVNTISKRLLALGSPVDELANTILGVISTASIELSQIFAHVINFFIQDDGLKAKIVTLSKAGTLDAQSKLEGYIREALREFLES